MTFFSSDNRFTTLNIRDNARIFATDKKQQRLVHLKEYHFKMYLKNLQLNEDAETSSRKKPASHLVKFSLAHDKLADIVNGGVYASKKPKDINNFRKAIESFFDSHHNWRIHDHLSNDIDQNPLNYLDSHGIDRRIGMNPALKRAILQTHELSSQKITDIEKQKFLEIFDRTSHEKRADLIRDLISGKPDMFRFGSGYTPDIFFGKRMGFRTIPGYGNIGDWKQVNSGYLHPDIQEYHEQTSTGEPLDVDVLKTIGEQLRTHRTSGGNIIPGYIPTTRDIAAVHAMERGISPTDWLKDVYKATIENRNIRNIIGGQFDRQGSSLPHSWPAHVSEYAENNPRSEIGGYYRRYHQLPHDWTPEGWHEGMQDMPQEQRTETSTISVPKETRQEIPQETQITAQIEEPETIESPRRNIMDVVKAILRKKII